LKKHNKDILKATLFALIAIFVMVGIAGILYANHKKKIQKEQQKKAAIEALDGGESLFFSHYDPKTVEWFMSIL
jgi:hypothetical protein